MTGGTVVILGDTGKNFAAGMSGGTAYVLDENSDLYTKLNEELILFTDVTSERDITKLRALITEHYQATGSKKAEMILNDFDNYIRKFKKIIPRDYKLITATIDALKNTGKTDEQAQIEAFYQLVGSKA